MKTESYAATIAALKIAGEALRAIHCNCSECEWRRNAWDALIRVITRPQLEIVPPRFDQPAV